MVLLAVVLGEAEPPGPGLAGIQAQLTHEGPDELGTARHTPSHEIGVDPSVPLGPVGIVKGFGDERFELLAPFRGRRRWPCFPFVESRAGHFQKWAHPDDRERGCGVRDAGCVLCVDELEPVAHR